MFSIAAVVNIFWCHFHACAFQVRLLTDSAGQGSCSAVLPWDKWVTSDVLKDTSPLTLPDPASLLRYEPLALPWLLLRLQSTQKKPHPKTITTTRTQTSEKVPVLPSDWKHSTSPLERFGHRRCPCDRSLNRNSQWQASKWGNTFMGEVQSAETPEQSQRKHVSIQSPRWPQLSLPLTSTLNNTATLRQMSHVVSGEKRNMSQRKSECRLAKSAFEHFPI